jgi:hypothetical protein
MSLAPGTRLGAYEIVAQIVAGGMGEVYRALSKLRKIGSTEPQDIGFGSGPAQGHEIVGTRV